MILSSKGGLIDNMKYKLEIHAKASVFPWIKIGAFNSSYSYKGKPAVKVGSVSLRISFFDLFSKKLTFKKIEIDNAEFNLSNFPPIELNLHDNTSHLNQHIKGSNSGSMQEKKLTNNFDLFSINELFLSNIKIMSGLLKNPVLIQSLVIKKDSFTNDYLIKSTIKINGEVVRVNGVVNRTQRLFKLTLQQKQKQNNAEITINKGSGIVSGTFTAKLPHKTALKKLFNSEEKNTPIWLLLNFEASSQQLKIPLFKIRYPNGFISASVLIYEIARPGMSMSMNMTVTEELFKAIVKVDKSSCFIPYYLRDVVRGLNTTIHLSLVNQSRETFDESQSTKININLKGVEYNSAPSPVIEGPFNACFKRYYRKSSSRRLDVYQAHSIWRTLSSLIIFIPRYKN
jgi:hypothetical protein